MSTVEDRLRAALAAKADAVSLLDDHVELPEPVPLLVLLAPDQQVQRRWPVALAAIAAAVILIAVGVTIVAGRGGNDPAAASRARVPWSQVGPDWTLVVAGGSASMPEHDLELISPAGVRYLICRLPDPLIDLQPWTTSTGKAILTTKGYEDHQGTEHPDKDVLIVDLHTGRQSRIRITSEFDTIQFASPNLDSLLVTYESSAMQLVSARTGQLLVRYPVSNVVGSALSPDYSQVVIGRPNGLVIFDRASGRQLRTLPPPTGYNFCYVLRWGPATEVLAQCYDWTNSKTPVANLMFTADGSRPPQPAGVPAGWQEIRLAGGNIAYQRDGLGNPALMNYRFARVVTADQLTMLATPAELTNDDWAFAAIGSNLLLFEKVLATSDNQHPLELAAWNPLTGSFTTLVAAGSGQSPISSYASWQQYQLTVP